jgi:hypothetical protein
VTAAVVSEIGWKAAAALQRSRRLARVVARLADSAWVDAAGEIVWLGHGPTPRHHGPTPRHPRAIFTTSAIPGGNVLAFDLEMARVWRAFPLPALVHGNVLVDECRALEHALDALGTPRGLATMRKADGPDIPDEIAERATAAIERLRIACAADDAIGALEAATPLLGLGQGLTPAGDDLLGGVFFARSLLARGGCADQDAWQRAGAALVAAARVATHPVSAALLEDLVAMDSHEALHRLATSLIDGQRRAALVAARDLVGIGSSSGWDILGGFLLGSALV